jgi:transcriptional regulator with XRE-family HTH domain
MKEMTLIQNLQQLMRIHGNLSVTELAKLTNLPQPTIHHILSGSTRNPRKKAMQALSAFFSLSVEQLIGTAPMPNIIIPEEIKENFQLTTIPIIPWDLLKKWPLTHKNLHFKEILLDKKVANNSFALIVQDSSMEPLFFQNTLLIFDSGKCIKDRDFVIVHLGREDILLFNRIFIENNKNYLRQDLEDGNVKLIKLHANIDRIIATLIETRTEY